MEFTRPHAIAAALSFAMLFAQTSAGAEQTPLATFRPGAPGEPAWTVLKLDVMQSGASLDLMITATDYRCPFAWGFVLFTGEAPNVVQRASFILDYRKGYEGVEARSTGPVAFDHSTMWNSGAKECDSPGFRTGFAQIPMGTAYLLAYAAHGADAPFRGDAVVSSPDGNVRVTASAHGDRTFYLDMMDFGAGDPRVSAHSPGFCVWPALDPENNFCDPCCWWTGGNAASADVGAGRAANLTFENQPFFLFSTSTSASVSNATVTDPLGRVKYVQAFLSASAGGVAANAGGPTYLSKVPSEHPPGEYRFDIRFNAEAGLDSVAWHVSAADYVFPT